MARESEEKFAVKLSQEAHRRNGPSFTLEGQLANPARVTETSTG